MDVKAHFTELASSIEKSSHLLGDWYSQPSTQQLSNEKFGQTSRNLDPLKLPDEIRRAKKTLLEATWELQGLSAEPLDFLAQHRINVRLKISQIYIFFRYNVLAQSDLGIS